MAMSIQALRGSEETGRASPVRWLVTHVRRLVHAGDISPRAVPREPDVASPAKSRRRRLTWIHRHRSDGGRARDTGTRTSDPVETGGRDTERASVREPVEEVVTTPIDPDVARLTACLCTERLGEGARRLERSTLLRSLDGLPAPVLESLHIYCRALAVSMEFDHPMASTADATTGSRLEKGDADPWASMLSGLMARPQDAFDCTRQLILGVSLLLMAEGRENGTHASDAGVAGKVAALSRAHARLDPETRERAPLEDVLVAGLLVCRRSDLTGDRDLGDATIDFGTLIRSVEDPLLRRALSEAIDTTRPYDMDRAADWIAAAGAWGETPWDEHDADARLIRYLESSWMSTLTR